MLADALATYTARRRPRLDARLLELDFGAWEGRAWAAIPRAAIESWGRALLGRAGAGGESGAALIARVRRFARALLARGGRHVVVGHAGPLAVLEALLLGRSPDLLAPRLAPGEARLLRVTDGRGRRGPRIPPRVRPPRAGPP